MTPTAIAGYLALFAGVGFLFLFVNLLIGKLVRPAAPHAEKLEIYECGEPTIGSSFVQFDLRFYVVALLFIIFDVEVAFFFPWATVFGKSTQLQDPQLIRSEAVVQPYVSYSGPAGSEAWQLNPAYAVLQAKLGVPASALPVQDLGSNRVVAEAQARQQAASLQAAGAKLASSSFVDILVFFSVLMVGFAYVWKRGDLDWVRALSTERGLRFSRPRGDPDDLDDPAPPRVLVA